MKMFNDDPETDAKLAIMEECGYIITRNPGEMARLLKGLL